MKPLTFLTAWQGGAGAIPWSQEELIDPQRLPDDLESLDHPDGWDQDFTHTMVDWIRLGQAAHLDENKRFQFQQLYPHTDSRLRRNMHTNSSLRYGPESRIFMARLVLDDDQDTIAHNERSKYFVSPLRASTTRLFDEEEEKDMLSRASGLAQMENLIRVLLKYKAVHPIRVRASSGFAFYAYQ